MAVHLVLKKMKSPFKDRGMKDQLIECVRLKAKLSPMACLQNRIRAMTLSSLVNIGPGPLKVCLGCEIGWRVRAYLPGDQP